MSMSEYEKAEIELEDRRCEDCHGGGRMDDASPFDIEFNTWECTTCNGTGFKPCH